jgi:dipeptidyl aminopeptidase/acylaminoacyl peptidase
VASDEPPQRTDEERHNKAFEAAHNDFLTLSQPLPAHLWVVPAAGGTPERLTSGSWSLPIAFPPSSPASPPSWSPDGKSIAIVRVATAYSGDRTESVVQVLDLETRALRPLTGGSRYESQPRISPDGLQVAYWYPRDGQTRNVNEIHLAPAAGGPGTSLTRGLDRNVMRGIWLPDSKSLLVSANDRTSVGWWIQPLDGPARPLSLGKVVPTTGFWLDASVGPKGQIAFTGSEPHRAVELYYLASAASAPERLTDFNAEVAALELGRVERVEWDGPDGFRMDGVLTYPPDFTAGRKYPLVLYIHGGPPARLPRKRSPAGPSCSRPRAGLFSSPTIGAATTWATRFKPPSGMTPAPARGKTSCRESSC